MPLRAVIEVAFDPLLQLGELTFRWQALAVAGAILVALALATQLGRYPSTRDAIFRTSAPKGLHRPVRRRLLGSDFPEAPTVSTDAPPTPPLRADDLLFIVLGIVPGAVAGGRLVHGLAFWDVYAAQPERLIDPELGSLSLLGAVLGGALSAGLVCLLLGAPVRRWADVAALPMLLAVGLGKLGQFLGGSGQGAAFDGPWAVAFVGDRPWISAAPEVPSHPAQVYEAVWVLLGIPFVLWLVARRPETSPILRVDGRLFLVAVAWFLVGRVVVGFSWRDETMLGPLNAEQLLALVALAVMAGGVALAVLLRRAGRRGDSGAARYRGAVPPP